MALQVLATVGQVAERAENYNLKKAGGQAQEGTRGESFNGIGVRRCNDLKTVYLGKELCYNPPDGTLSYSCFN